MKNKQFFSFLFCFILLISLIACSGDMKKNTTSENSITVSCATIQEDLEPIIENITFENVNIEDYNKISAEYTYSRNEVDADFQNLTDRIYGEDNDLNYLNKEVNSDNKSFELPIKNHVINQKKFPYISRIKYLNENKIIVSESISDSKMQLVIQDLNKPEKEIIHTTETGVNTQDILINEKYIFWVESENSMEKLAETWKIMKYSLTTKEVSKILSYDDFNSKMLPRINIYEGLILFTSLNSDSHKHSVVALDIENGETKELFKLNYVVNPFTRAFIHEDSLYVPDYTQDGAVILKYDFVDGELYKYKPKLEYETEYISEIRVSDDKLAFDTSIGLLYLVSNNDIDLVSHTVFSLGFADNNLIFTKNGKLFGLNFATGETHLLDNTGYYTNFFYQEYPFIIQGKIEDSDTADYLGQSILIIQK